MNFTSDNVHGAWPEMIAAIAKANEGTDASYGEDAVTRRLNEKMSALFEREVAVFPVTTGTAANALALSTVTPPHGAIVCHAESHIAFDECGAPEFFTHGAKLATVEGAHAKLTPKAVETALSRFQFGLVHFSQPACISITQASEMGACYRPQEVAALAAIAHARGMALHMDGARFANAVAFLGCGPAGITWRAGVDVLSFGATKGGALGAEAVIFFEPGRARDFEYRRKRSGHLLSKFRFVAAQLETYIDDNRWLRHAAHANAMARKLGEGLAAIAGSGITSPVEANLVFAKLPKHAVARLREAGAQFYDWPAAEEDKTLLRLVCSFATREEDVAAFVKTAAA